jgi:hypothetical protein
MAIQPIMPTFGNAPGAVNRVGAPRHVNRGIVIRGLAKALANKAHQY